MKTVPLYGAKAAGRVALVDDADYGSVMQHRWFVLEFTRAGVVTGPYAIARLPGRQTRRLYMHKMLTGYARTDHINHDGLDNRRSNLRAATSSQNSQNARKLSDSQSSRFKGVCWKKHARKWYAYIQAPDCRRSLGYYATEEAAALAYNAAALEAFGEFACLNQVDPEPVPLTASQPSLLDLEAAS